MKILFIRHGDPDYENDSLTIKGDEEAKLLAQRLNVEKIDKVFVSPLGRAKRTAEFTLKSKGMEAIEKDWLAEFMGKCIRPDNNREMICWDFLPEHWTNEACFYDKDNWIKSKYFDNTNVAFEYKRVCSGIDKIIYEHGYQRKDNLYLAKEPNNDTIAIFCHFGVTCIMLSHLLGISPMVMLHGFVAAPSSVTTVCTEERREGIAAFRMSSYGDISHLYAGNEEPSFQARFCECFFNKDQRHD